VLTAAHCLAGESRINVIAGEYDTQATSGNEQERWSSKIVSHPDYNSRTTSYDYGLVKLESPVSFGSCVGAVNLPSGDVVSGESCWITGWGTLSSGGSSPRVLQEAQVTVLSNTECTRDYGYSSSDIDESMLCAQGRTSSGAITDACQGDSGGPLVCKSGGQWVIHGATSWGYGCAGATYPGVWARVYKELDWIEFVMSEAPAPTPAPGTWTLKGSGCELSGNCAQSLNYPSNYGNGESCTIELGGEISIAFTSFNTESRYDFLTIGGTSYSGTSAPPGGAYSGTIDWSSDYSVTRPGWKLCKA